MGSLDRLHPHLQHAILHDLGWRSLRPVQDLTIDAVLDGANTVVREVPRPRRHAPVRRPDAVRRARGRGRPPARRRRRGRHPRAVARGRPPASRRRVSAHEPDLVGRLGRRPRTAGRATRRRGRHRTRRRDRARLLVALPDPDRDPDAILDHRRAAGPRSWPARLRPRQQSRSSR